MRDHRSQQVRMSKRKEIVRNVLGDSDVHKRKIPSEQKRKRW